MALLLTLHAMKGGEMPAVTRKELILLGQAQADYKISLCEMKHEGTRWWKMTLGFRDGQVLDVQTALGKLKLWKRLDIAVDFIKETCPGARDVRIVFEVPMQQEP
jgi:hypothetical protein